MTIVHISNFLPHDLTQAVTTIKLMHDPVFVGEIAALVVPQANYRGAADACGNIS